MRRTALLALLVSALTTVPARAEFLGWQYSWTVSPTSIATTSNEGDLIFFGTFGSSTMTYESLLAAGIYAEALPFPQPFGSIGTFGTLEPTPYTLTLTLHDEASGTPGSLHFDGMLSGSYSDLSNTFIGSTMQQVVLGDNRYNVSVGPFYSPTTFFPGIFGASVEATPVAVEAPEPATLVLAACALPGLVFAACRRRSRR